METCAWCKGYFDGGYSYRGMVFCSESCCNAYIAQENRAEAQNEATMEAAKRQEAAERDRADAERERASAIDRQTEAMIEQEESRQADEIAKQEYPRYQELLKRLCAEYEPKFACQEERFKGKTWTINTDLRKKIIADGKTKRCPICNELLSVKQIDFTALGVTVKSVSEKDFLTKPNEGEESVSSLIVKKFDPVTVDMGFKKFREKQFDAKSGIAFHENIWKRNLNYLDKLFEVDDDIVVYGPTVVQVAPEKFTERKIWGFSNTFVPLTAVKRYSYHKIIQLYYDLSARPAKSAIDKLANERIGYSHKLGCAACHKKYLEEYTQKDEDQQHKETLKELKEILRKDGKNKLKNERKRIIKDWIKSIFANKKVRRILIGVGIVLLLVLISEFL